MEEMNRAGMWEGGGAPMPSLCTPLSAPLHVCQPQKLSEPLHLGFSWQLHYVDIID